LRNTELPSGWKRVKLGEILKLRNGYAFKSESFGNVGVPVIRISNIQNNHVTVSDSVRVSEQLIDDNFIIENGDVLIAMSGATTGKYGIYSSHEVALQNQRVGNFKPHVKEISKRFIYYLLGELKERIEEGAYGAAQPNISSKLIEELDINLPPLAEQQRIVAKLDALFGHLEALRTRLDRIPELLKNFRQQVLTQAVTGKLTEEWRRGGSVSVRSGVTIGQIFNEAPNGWRWTLLTDIADLESGHTPRKTIPEYWERGNVPWISLQDIRAAHGRVIDETKYMPTELGIQNSSARLLPKGTVCFSRDISVGFATIMGRSMATTQHFANWICSEKISNRYLLYSFMASREFLINEGKGTTVRTIYMPALKQFHILLPPIEEQSKIVTRVEALFNIADKIETQYQSLKAKIDALPQAILTKAFKGELLPQDPNDEPAEVLLERIKGEKTGAIKKGRKVAEVDTG
jgi:type I restriction enzyme, S subunit